MEKDNGQPSNYLFYPPDKQLQARINWEKHNLFGREVTIVGEILPTGEYRGSPIGGNRYLFCVDSQTVQNMAKRWFDVE